MTTAKESKKQIKGSTTSLTLPAWWRKMLLENYTAKLTDKELSAKAKAEFGDYADRLTPRRARKIYNDDRKRGIRGLKTNAPAAVPYTKE